jgi:hypothetical protein
MRVGLRPMFLVDRSPAKPSGDVQLFLVIGYGAADGQAKADQKASAGQERAGPGHTGARGGPKHISNE